MTAKIYYVDIKREYVVHAASEENAVEEALRLEEKEAVKWPGTIDMRERVPDNSEASQ